jgi:hypothetical protein
MDVEMPDGVIVQGVPDGTPKAEIMARYQRSRRMAALPQSLANIAEDQAALNPVEKPFREGAGKAFVDIARGAGQLVGVVSRDDVAESRRVDAPLIATTGGKVGNFAGNIAAAVPAAMIPGANTVAGAGVIGAGLGLLQPSTSTRETATNVGLGGALGAGGQKLGSVIADKASKSALSRAAAAAQQKADNAIRDQTLAAARKAGYVVPPTHANPTMTNTIIESVSGKAQTQQVAAIKNQRVTDSLVRQELKLPGTAPITKQALEGIRNGPGRSTNRSSVPAPSLQTGTT